jgi:hypothetical protein
VQYCDDALAMQVASTLKKIKKWIWRVRQTKFFDAVVHGSEQRFS